jgi:excisionase family DNA binding protein
MRTAVSEADQVVEQGFATLDEACKFLRICRAGVYGLMDRGEIAYAKFGKSRRLAWKSLRDYAARSMVSRQMDAE